LKKKRAADDLGLSLKVEIEGMHKDVPKCAPISEQDSALLSTLTWLLYYYEHEIRNGVKNGVTTGKAFQEAALKDNTYTDGYESYLGEIKSRIEKLTGEFKLGDYPQGIKNDIEEEEPEEAEEETEEVVEEPEPEPVKPKGLKVNPFVEKKRREAAMALSPAEGRS